MKDFKDRIINSLKDLHPQKIILFGSYARGEQDGMSDIDLIFVYETNKRFLARIKEIYEKWNIPKGVDILAYTPAEYEQMLETNAFLQDVVADGEIIYENRRT